MIDNIKFYINDKDQFEYKLNQSQVIDLNAKFNVFTSEYSEYPKIGKLHNMDVRITKEKAFITGSLHKLNNILFFDNPHNYDDFNICEITCISDFICDSLSIDPLDTKITNLEFGFNIRVAEDPQHILDKIIMYDFQSHTRDEKFRGRGDFKEFCTTAYSLKVYNKSKQYLLAQNILRVELKIYSKAFLNKMGVYCLGDLDISVYRALFKVFLERFDKLIILDSLNAISSLKSPENNFLLQGVNPSYWLNLKRNATRNVIAHRKVKFNNMYNENYSCYIKNELRNSLITKFEELTQCNSIHYLQKVA